MNEEQEREIRDRVQRYGAPLARKTPNAAQAAADRHFLLGELDKTRAALEVANKALANAINQLSDMRMQRRRY